MNPSSNSDAGARLAAARIADRQHRLRELRLTYLRMVPWFILMAIVWTPFLWFAQPLPNGSAFEVYPVNVAIGLGLGYCCNIPVRKQLRGLRIDIARIRSEFR